MGTTLLIILFISVPLLLLLMPVKGAGAFRYRPPLKRIHEADAVLSRRLLKPGTPEYIAYYRDHPDFQKPDERSRKSPGLLSAQSRFYHPETFACADAQFALLESLSHLTHGEPAPGSSPSSPASSGKTAPESPRTTRNEVVPEPPVRMKPDDPGRASGFIKNWLLMDGAHSVGFTELKDYHLYSHKGRGPRRGDPIHRTHRHAIAITVEMNHRMMRSAPLGTSVMESSAQYLRSGILALKTARMIRSLGFEATAHIDGNYEVICPLVAVDAGLGVIGRMGLLMTPRLGPRVRISVVTTNLPLLKTDTEPDPTTIHFCHHCRKCAEVCPVSAIPFKPRTEIDGVTRWQIDSEKCYHYWTLSGTDCGRCMSACPYSHPDNLFHRLIRRGIKNNLFFRYLAIKLDDVFYGRKPPVRPLPRWADMTDKP